MQKDLEQDNGHLLVLVLKRSGTVSVKTVHKEYVAELPKACWCNSQKADVQFSALGAHCPEVNSEVKDIGKLSIHFAAVSANQLSLYGAVAEICEEYESRHDRSGQLFKVMGQSSSSLGLSVIKTEVLLD